MSSAVGGETDTGEADGTSVKSGGEGGSAAGAGTGAELSSTVPDKTDSVTKAGVSRPPSAGAGAASVSDTLSKAEEEPEEEEKDKMGGTALGIVEFVKAAGMSCPVCSTPYSSKVGPIDHQYNAWPHLPSHSPKRAAHPSGKLGTHGTRIVEEELADSSPLVPRQLTGCGHIVCSSCLVEAHLTQVEHAVEIAPLVTKVSDFNETAAARRAAARETHAEMVEKARQTISFFRPAKLTFPQFRRYLRMVHPSLTSLECPIEGCSILTEGFTCVDDLNPMFPVTKRTDLTKLEWRMDGTTHKAEEEVVVEEDPEERLKMLMSVPACTDCMASLRGDCPNGGKCVYRHPPKPAITGGVICAKWLKGDGFFAGCPHVDCLRLHPTKGMTSRTDCLAYMHPRLFCSGKRFGKTCPFRHDARVAKASPKPGFCHKWGDYVCNDMFCKRQHPKDRPPPVDVGASMEMQGVVGVFWDMSTCPVPPGGWTYGVGMGIQRWLRQKGLLAVGPGRGLEFSAYGPGLTEEMMVQLSTARARVRKAGEDDLSGLVGAISASKITKGVAAMINYDLLEFSRKYKRKRTKAIVLLTASSGVVPTINRLTLKDFHVIVVHPTHIEVGTELLEAATELATWPEVESLAHTSPPKSEMAKAKAEKKLSFEPVSNGPGPCQRFKPAIQTGCPAGDACPYHHEKRPCPSMIRGISDCPYGLDCRFRHVPMSGTTAKEAYKAMAKKVPGAPSRGNTGVDWWNPQGDQLTHARNIRKVYNVPKHDGMKHWKKKDDAVVFLAPPGYWQCSACSFKFNPPTRGETTGVTCSHCLNPMEEFGKEAQMEEKTPVGCWFCPVCFFAGNTVGMDSSCQVCLAEGGARAEGLPALWTCPACTYLNDETLDQCDFCQKAKPPQWQLDMAADDG